MRVEIFQKDAAQQPAHEREAAELQPESSATDNLPDAATGRMLNAKSTKCISHAHTQTGSMILKLDLDADGQQHKERQQEMAEDDDHAHAPP